jgi:hypothetical protein
MCRHLSDSPMTPLPMARVVLKDYPADAAVADEPATTSAGRLML